MKKSTKNIVIILIAVILTGTVVGAFSYVTEGFRNWNTNEWLNGSRNAENLLKLKNYVEDRLYSDNGTNIEIQEDGAIYFEQKTADVDGVDTKFVFATVTLNPGTYTYTGSPEGTSSTYKLMAEHTGDDGVTRSYYADNTGTRTFVLNERTEVTFYLLIVDSFATENTVAVYPTLASGEHPIDFYVK